MALATALTPISGDSPKTLGTAEKPWSSVVLYRVLISSVTVLAFLLRFHALTTKSFWLDEGISVAFARLPWLRFLEKMASGEANMVLYYVVLRFWLMIGTSEGFIRGLSVLFSVATVPLISFLGARLFNRRAGLVAALLFAVNAYDIRFAQEARSYTMVVFFAVLATWLLARNLLEPSKAHWTGYAIVCALLIYTHLFAILLLPAHAISLLSWQGHETGWRRYARSLLTFSVMMVPVAIFLFWIFVLEPGGRPSLWFPPLQPDSLLILGVDFSGVYGRTLLILDVLAVGVAAWGAAQPRRSAPDDRGAWGYTLLFSWLVAPVVIVLTVSLVKPLFVPRFLIFCLPALVLLVAVGICRLRPATLAAALFMAISVCSLLGVLRYYQSDFDMRRQDWRAVTKYVFDHAKPGDSIFFFPLGGEPCFEYYWQRNSSSLSPETLRAELEKDSNGRNLPDLVSDGLVHVPGTNLRIAPPARSRVWLVLMSLDGTMQEYIRGIAVVTWLNSGRQQMDEQDFTPLKVMLFDRVANGSPAIGEQASVKP